MENNLNIVKFVIEWSKIIMVAHLKTKIHLENIEKKNGKICPHPGSNSDYLSKLQVWVITTIPQNLITHILSSFYL